MPWDQLWRAVGWFSEQGGVWGILALVLGAYVVYLHRRFDRQRAAWDARMTALEKDHRDERGEWRQSSQVMHSEWRTTMQDESEKTRRSIDNSTEVCRQLTAVVAEINRGRRRA